MSVEEKTPYQVVDQLKSQGFFDKIRKQCLEEIDGHYEYKLLQEKVHSHVTEFLDQQSWNPSIEKLKLREKMHGELTKANLIKGGVDKLVRQALRLKMSKAFRDQISRIVCGHFGISEEVFNNYKCEVIQSSENERPLINSDSLSTLRNQSSISSQYQYPLNQLSNIQSIVPSSYVVPSNNYPIPPPNIYYQSVNSLNDPKLNSQDFPTNVCPSVILPTESKV